MRVGGWVLVAVLAVGCGDDDEAVVRADPETEAPSEAVAEAEESAPAPERVVDEAPSEVDAPDETDVIEAPTDAPLPEKMGRRLRNWLREQHRVRSDIAAQHSIPREDGGRAIVTLLRFSPFEACVAAKEDAGTAAEEARTQCATMRDPSDWELEPSTSLRLLMGHFTATPPRRPAGWGGALAVPVDVLLTESCSLSGDPIIERGDLDGDGADEVAVRFGCASGDSMNRAEVFAKSTESFLTVLRMDGAFQLSSFVIGATAEDIEMANEQMAREVRFADENGDGKADMIVETLTWEGSNCGPDDVTILDDEADDDVMPECLGERERQVYLYQPASDTWDVPERSR